MSEEHGQEERRSRRLFREVGLVYGAVLATIIFAALLAVAVPLVASFLYAIVAFIFFVVPQWWMEKKGLSEKEFGMTLKGWPRALGWGLLFTAVTVPFFVAGYWIWETHVLERSFRFDWEHYRQWSAELEGEPKSWGAEGPGVWIWAHNDRLKLGIRNEKSANQTVGILADQPFKPRKRGTINLKPLDAPAGAQKSQAWAVALTSGNDRGVVTISGVETIEVDVEPAIEGHDPWPLYAGPSAERLEDHFEDERGYGWLGLWILTQFLLIALPEEYFYRGFLQTRLSQAFAARKAEQGDVEEIEEAGREVEPSLWGFTPSILVTSVLFGLGHLLVPVGGVLLANRASVFFPSLLFGWVKRRTDSIVSSTVYHAFSNMMVLVAAVHFV